MGVATPPIDYRTVLAKGARELVIEVRGVALYTYARERLPGAPAPKTDAKVFGKPEAARKQAEKLRASRLEAGWQEAEEGAPAPASAARTFAQAGRELRAALEAARPGTLGALLDVWERWGETRVLGSQELFSAEVDWGAPRGHALSAAPAGEKTKRLALRRWWLDLRSGPGAVELEALVPDGALRVLEHLEGPRGRVRDALRAALAGADGAAVRGLYLHPA